MGKYVEYEVAKEMATKEMARLGFELRAIDRLPSSDDLYLFSTVGYNERKKEFCAWYYNTDFDSLSVGHYSLDEDSAYRVFNSRLGRELETVIESPTPEDAGEEDEEWEDITDDDYSGCFDDPYKAVDELITEIKKHECPKCGGTEFKSEYVIEPYAKYDSKCVACGYVRYSLMD